MSTFRVPIVTIKELVPIAKADLIELAKFKENEWQLVVQKGHKVGDLVAYVPPDSCFTDEKVAELDIKYLKNGNRVGAIKLRGVYSYGMSLPCPDGYSVGDDVSEFYQITKWEQPEDNRNITRRGVQGAVWRNTNAEKYTDIENILSHPGIFEDRELVSVTEKVHGSNCEFGWVRKQKLALWEHIPYIDRLFPDAGWEFLACSRNGQYKVGKDDNLWTKIALKYDLPNKLRKFRNYMVCGEIYGAGVQDLTYGLSTQNLVCFDIFKVNSRTYMHWPVSDNVLQSLDLPVVPELYRGPYDHLFIESLCIGKTMVGKNPAQMREGIVIKPLVEQYSDVLRGRKIAKLVSPEYLSRKDGTEHH